MEDLLDEGHLDSGKNELESIDDRLKNLPKFELGKYFSESGRIYGKTLGPVIGFLIIIYIASYLSGLVPFASNLISWLLITPMQVGVLIYYARALHGKENEFGNLFCGFKFYGNVILGAFLQGLILVIFAVILMLVMFYDLFIELSQDGAYLLQDQFYIQSLIYNYGWLLILYLFIFIAASIFFFNMYSFILLRKVSATKALSYSFQLGAKKYLPFFGLILLLSVMNVIGALFLGIGLLFTIPLSIGLVVAAFDHLIGADSEIPA